MSRCVFLMTALVALTAAAGAPAARAGKPAPIEEIPLYPGATPAPEDDSISVPLLGFTLDQERRYIVKAAPETVVHFYQQKLAAREVSTEQFEEAIGQAENGDLEGARMTLAFHDFRSPAVSPPLREAIKKREPFRQVQWVSMARFVWSRQQADGAVLQFGVGLLDGQDLSHNEPRTILSVSAGVIEPDDEDADEEALSEDEAGDGPGDTTSAKAKPVAEPSPASLGVPRYPGASFDGRGSAAMSSDKEHSFIYRTGDPAEKVVAFYERELKKKGTKTEGSVLIAVKGTPPRPELGVTVQKNAGTYPSDVKTIITVRHSG
jgi:hypothetical protein